MVVTLWIKRVKKIKELNDQLKELRNENRMLKNNQKKNKFDDGGLVYAVRSPNTKKMLIRIGKTKNMKKRKPNIDTTMPDKFIVLYTLKVDNPTAVEYCIRALLNKFKYRNNKDYYDCSLKQIKEIFDKCKEFVTTGIYCKHCDSHITNINKLAEHSLKYHNINENDNLVLNIFDEPEALENKIDQLGGHIEYKFKYIL